MSGIGDRMAAAAKSASAGDAAPSRGGLRVPDAPDAAASAVVDDDEFYDDGLTQDEDIAALEPVGPVTLANGVEYKPRSIHGVEDLAWLRDNRDHKDHILLYGPPGTGKTAVAESAFMIDAVLTEAARDGSAVARASYVHYGIETLVCSADTTEADFLGTFVQDPNEGLFTWAPGPLHRAVMYDIPIFVDEVFLCDPRVLSSVLYPLMDGRDVLRIPSNPTLPPLSVGPGFFVIGAGNPDVPGAMFSDALRDRFSHHVEVGTDWQLAKELKVPNDIITVAKNLDKQRRDGVIGWSPQLRSLLAYRDTKKRYGQAYAIKNLVSKAPFEDRPTIIEAMEKKFGKDKATPLTMGGRHRA